MSDAVRHYFYRGSSMLGTFKRGDYLTVVPLPLDRVRRGDIVAYRRPDQPISEETLVVHRVVRTVRGGLIVHGDSNPTRDVYMLLEEDLIGRVILAERRGKVRKIHGGLPGILRGAVLHNWHGLKRRVARPVWIAVRSAGRPPYRWLRDSGLVGHLWRPSFTRIELPTEHGPLFLYMYRERVVAYWLPVTGRYKCYRPFDLVLLKEFQQQADAGRQP